MSFQSPIASKQDSALESCDEHGLNNGAAHQISRADFELSKYEIEMALRRLGSHDLLRKSPKLFSFLSYAVSETLAGRGDRLKAYSIGVAALGKHSAFDPSNDPIVRVEATRLRRSLNVYYAGDGKNDPIQIKMPPGSYQPIFERVGEEKSFRKSDFEALNLEQASAMDNSVRSSKYIFSQSFFAIIRRQAGEFASRSLHIINIALVVFLIVFGYRVLIEIEQLNKRIDQLDAYWVKHLSNTSE